MINNIRKTVYTLCILLNYNNAKLNGLFNEWYIMANAVSEPDEVSCTHACLVI